MFVCRILWRFKLSWLFWPGFFLNLYNYNRNTVTRIEIATSLCGNLINWFNNMIIVFLHMLLLDISKIGIHVFPDNIYFKPMLLIHILPKYGKTVTNILQQTCFNGLRNRPTEVFWLMAVCICRLAFKHSHIQKRCHLAQ